MVHVVKLPLVYAVSISMSDLKKKVKNPLSSSDTNRLRGCPSTHTLSKVSFSKVSKSKFSPKVSK